MDDTRATANVNIPHPAPQDPRIRQRELLNRKYIPETYFILGMVELYIAGLVEMLSTPKVIVEHLKRGETIPLFEEDTLEKVRLLLKHVENFPHQLIRQIRNVYQVDDEDLQNQLAQIRVGVAKLKSEHFEGYSFIVEKLFANKTKDIKLLVSPYEDTTPFDFLLHKTLNIGVDRNEATQATAFKNEVVVPRYISRLNELISAGFQLDPKALEERIDLLFSIPVFVDVDDYKKMNGYYNPRFGAIHISHFIPGKSEEKTKSILYHELSHLLSSISDLDAPEISVGLRRVHYSDDPTIEKRHTELGRVLNEAFTSSLQEWLFSEETPRFGRMTVAEFFKGPGDFDGSYSDEREFFAVHIGNMPIGNMTRAYFEDCKLPNKIGETRSYRDFLKTLSDYYPGGFELLSGKWAIAKDLDAQTFVSMPK